MFVREALQVIHDLKVRSAIAANGGYLVKSAGDAFMASFASAQDAVRCAMQIQRSLAEGDDSEDVRAARELLAALA